MKNLNFTAGQLGLFLGCTIHVTQAFIDEVIKDFNYNPGYDTQTPFTLFSVSQTGFTISWQNGSIIKIFALEDYGVKAQLQLIPIVSDTLTGLDRASQAALFIAGLALVNYDIFNFIPRGLAQPRRLPDEAKSAARAEIIQAIEDQANQPAELVPVKAQRYWFYYPEADSVFTGAWDELDPLTAGHVYQICSTDQIPEGPANEPAARQVLAQNTNTGTL